jgi:hypothetical protein
MVVVMCTWKLARKTLMLMWQHKARGVKNIDWNHHISKAPGVRVSTCLNFSSFHLRPPALKWALLVMITCPQARGTLQQKPFLWAFRVGVQHILCLNFHTDETHRSALLTVSGQDYSLSLTRLQFSLQHMPNFVITSPQNVFISYVHLCCKATSFGKHYRPCLCGGGLEWRNVIPVR